MPSFLELIKLVPLVGTATSLVECAVAAGKGESEKALWKFGEAAVGGLMDAVTIVTLGSASVATTSVKAATQAAAAATAKKMAAVAVVRAAGTTVMGRQCKEQLGASQTNTQGNGQTKTNKADTRQCTTCRKEFKKDKCRYVASGSGGDDPNRPLKLKGAHESGLEDLDSPIQSIEFDSHGRVSRRVAVIFPHHVRSDQRSGRGYSRFIEEHFRTLERQSGDQIGHDIPWCLSGPCNYVHNFFWQNPSDNANFFHELEKKIKKFLQIFKKEQPSVHWTAQPRYNRPGSPFTTRRTGTDHYIVFYLGDHEVDFDDIYWPNDGSGQLSKRFYRDFPDPFDLRNIINTLRKS